jgi:hypothetical protein
LEWMGLAAVGLAALLGLFALAYGFINAGKNLGGSVSGIASALEMISGTMENSATDEQTSLPALQEAADLSQSNGGGSPISMEAANKRIVEIHEKIIVSLSQAGEQAIIRKVSKLLSNERTVAKGVLTLEILDKEKANELFQRLGNLDQSRVMQFMENGSFDRPKAEVMLEAAEELNTALLSAGFRSNNADVSEEVSQLLLKFDDDDLINITQELHQDTIPRLFVYLTPEQIGRVLKGVQNDENKFMTSISAVPMIPQVVNNRDLDKELLPVLEKQISTIDEDSQRSYLSLYKEIVETLDDEVNEHVINGMGAVDDRINTYLQNNVVTLATFFKLAADIKEELISSMSNKDIAGFIFSLTTDKASGVIQLAGERRVELIQEELDRFESFTKRQRVAATDRGKKMVLGKIKAMAAETTLDELFTDNQQDTQKEILSEGGAAA